MANSLKNLNIVHVALLVGIAIVALSFVTSTTGFGTNSYTGNPGTPTKQVEFCTDPDGTNVNTKSQCTDITGRHSDYCYTDSRIVEYACNYNTCAPKDPEPCATGNCVDGRCIA